VSDQKIKITYRRARWSDLKPISQFVDFWLSGRAKNQGIKNAGNDYFVSTSQHKSYLKKCTVFLAESKKTIVGWAVKERTNVLIHLLVAADMRGYGIGTELLRRLNPDIIRSKTDQQTGDPGPFYEKNGYINIGASLVGKKRNIQFMCKR
jgi:N-acetylglutamate synthase-like GNAT family acetyltransferase